MNQQEMKRIALMTIFQVPNYGSVLQAYASQQVLCSLGFDCEIINYRYPNHWHHRHGWQKPSPLARIRQHVASALNVGNGKVRNSLEDFRKTHLRLTREFKDYEDLSSYDWSGHILVTGSDQVWNPRFLKGDKAFMLGFAPQDVRKVSMSSSFACRSLDDTHIRKYHDYLGQYSAFSVRERNGASIITDQLNLEHDVHVMLDPTLLLPFSKWTELTPGGDTGLPYVLLYELTYSFDTKGYVTRLAEAMRQRFGCDRIITLGGARTVADAMDKHGCSVGEFLKLFRDATVVVTNSFHGTAFAVNAGKPVLSVIPDIGDDRQTTLLSTLGLRHCAVPVGTDPELTDPSYEVESEQALLNQKRVSDMEWLTDNI